MLWKDRFVLRYVFYLTGSEEKKWYNVSNNYRITQ